MTTATLLTSRPHALALARAFSRLTVGLSTQTFYLKRVVVVHKFGLFAFLENASNFFLQALKAFLMLVSIQFDGPMLLVQFLTQTVGGHLKNLHFLCPLL